MLANVCILGLLFSPVVWWNFSAVLSDSHSGTVNMEVIKIDVWSGGGRGVRWQLKFRFHRLVDVILQWKFALKILYINYFLSSFCYQCTHVCSPSTSRVTGDAVVIWRCNGPKCGLLYYRVKLSLPFISSLTLGGLFNLYENGNNNSIYLLHRVDMRVG